MGHLLWVEPGALRSLKLHGEGLVVVLPVPGSPHHVEQIKLSFGKLTWVTKNTILKSKVEWPKFTFLSFLWHDCTSDTLVCWRSGPCTLPPRWSSPAPSSRCLWNPQCWRWRWQEHTQKFWRRERLESNCCKSGSHRDPERRKINFCGFQFMMLPRISEYPQKRHFDMQTEKIAAIVSALPWLDNEIYPPKSKMRLTNP